MRRLTLLALALALGGLSLPAAASALDRAPRAAVTAARVKAADHFGTRDGVDVTFSARSARKRRWSLVDGEFRGRRLWAAWVRRGDDGRWRVRFFRTRRFDPGPPVPCDIRPAFSEPIC